MFGLPESTAFDKRIPKQKFYDNAEVSVKLKRYCIDVVQEIIWRNKISAADRGSVGTVAIEASDFVQEIEVIEIILSEQKVDRNFLERLDKSIPYHTLFIFTCDDESQLWMSYKKINNNSDSFSVSLSDYFVSDWLESEDISLEIKGLSLDEVYKNWLRELEPELSSYDVTADLSKIIEIHSQIKSLNMEKEKLKAKMKKEIQTNRMFDIKEQIKELNSKINELRASLD